MISTHEDMYENIHENINANIYENIKRNIHENMKKNMRMHQSAENERPCCQKGCAQPDANYLDASSGFLQMYT